MYSQSITKGTPSFWKLFLRTVQVWTLEQQLTDFHVMNDLCQLGLKCEIVTHEAFVHLLLNDSVSASVNFH
jgi:hypothetical protein